MKRIVKCCGAKLISSLGNLDGEESFESSSLGEAEEVYEESLGDTDFIFIKGV